MGQSYLSLSNTLTGFSENFFSSEALTGSASAINVGGSTSFKASAFAHYVQSSSSGSGSTSFLADMWLRAISVYLPPIPVSVPKPASEIVTPEVTAPAPKIFISEPELSLISLGIAYKLKNLGEVSHIANKWVKISAISNAPFANEFPLTFSSAHWLYVMSLVSGVSGVTVQEVKSKVRSLILANQSTARELTRTVSTALPVKPVTPKSGLTKDDAWNLALAVAHVNKRMAEVSRTSVVMIYAKPTAPNGKVFPIRLSTSIWDTYATKYLSVSALPLNDLVASLYLKLLTDFNLQ